MVHIENMIRSAYPALYNKFPSIALRPSIELLKRLFHEKEVNSFLDTHSRLYGLDFAEAVLDHLHISYTANQQQLENIPTIVANQMLSHIPQLPQLMIPVHNIQGKLTRKSLQTIDEALNNEETVIFFSASEVSRASFSGAKDSHWKNGFIKIAQPTFTPVLSVHIAARNSSLFYALPYIYKQAFERLLLGHEPRRLRMDTLIAGERGSLYEWAVQDG